MNKSDESSSHEEENKIEEKLDELDKKINSEETSSLPSTSTTKDEAAGDAKAGVLGGETDKLQHLCNDMFSKIALYINGEVDASVEDYKLLEKMNRVAIEKYDGMYEMAKATGDNLHRLNQKFEDLQPYLDQIEVIESSVSSLEQTAYKLDAYSKRLEERFKRIDRK